MKAEGDGTILAQEFRDTVATMKETPVVMNSMDDPEMSMTPKQVSALQKMLLTDIELNNGRWAMVGFATAIVMEAKTGMASPPPPPPPPPPPLPLLLPLFFFLHRHLLLLLLLLLICLHLLILLLLLLLVT
jgi:hypothetical protein